MLYILPLVASTLLATPPTVEYKVVDVHRFVSFAGRLGDRIEDTLVLSRDGMTYTVKLSAAHTRFGHVAEYSVGDHVVVEQPLLNVMTRDAIRRLSR